MPRWFPWVLGGVFGIVLMIVDYQHYHDGVIANSMAWGRDFINVWTGGKLVQAGQLGTIYDYDAYVRFQAALFGSLIPHNYFYPPFRSRSRRCFRTLPIPLRLACG